ncbi:MAG TPA: O-antigen ligase family protein [Methylomirabilota bacterium]|jgi:hypothetical protein|nr:O-antigen ligase family protein [Methylomirabilota bacterium]
MRSAGSLVRVRPEELLLIGLTGVLVVAGLTLGGEGRLAYIALSIPIVVGLSWWRPLYGFAALLGLVLLVEEFEILTMASGQPFLLELVPLYRSIEGFTSLPIALTPLELWLTLLGAFWVAQRIARDRLEFAHVPCVGPWLAAVGTLAVTFALGVARGGDLSAAIAEVRAPAYLLALIWFVPQLIESRRDIELLVGVMIVVLGIKAVQGLYRYVFLLHMHLDLRDTFMAHEDPVMFIPMLFLLFAVLHYGGAPVLRRALLIATPFMFVALVLTQRRTAYVTVSICAVFFAIELAPAARRAFVRYVLPVVVVLAAYVVVLGGSSSPLARPINRALQLFDPYNTSNLYRVVELDNLRYTVLEKPWGSGFGHPYQMVRGLPEIDFPLVEYIPHNEIMWIWVKAGTLGFILVMFFFARLVAESTWTYRHLRDPLFRAVATIIGLAIVNQLIVSYYDLQLTYARPMFYLGTLAGLLGPLREQSGLLRRPTGARWRLF